MTLAELLFVQNDKPVFEAIKSPLYAYHAPNGKIDTHHYMISGSPTKEIKFDFISAAPSFDEALANQFYLLGIANSIFKESTPLGEYETSVLKKVMHRNFKSTATIKGIM